MDELHPDLKRVLISEEEIANKNTELGKRISSAYGRDDPPYIIGILKGAFIFLADLTRKLSIPHVVDFMALSSYGSSSTSTGAVRILMDLREPIEGKHVLIVEDIVDTGQTLAYLNKALHGRRPASLTTCVLLQKERDALDVQIDFLGFRIPDVWVVGYGLDFADRFRTLPYIAELKKESYT